MLLVHSSHPKQQAQLEEQFDRDGYFFAVPFKNTDKIYCILESMILDVFGKSEPGESLALGKSSQSLIEKIKVFYQNILDQKFSLSAAREILQIIRRQEKKIALYEEYIISLDQRLEGQAFSEGDDEQLLQTQQEDRRQISKLFLDALERKSQRDIGGLEIEIQESQIHTEVRYLGNDSNFTNLSRMVNSVGSVSEIASPKNQDTSTMHTLKSEFQYFQRFSIPNFSESEKLNFDDEKLHNSFHYSAREESDEESQQFQNVDKVAFYSPPEKQSEQLHKKIIQNLSPVEKLNSDFIDLSGRLHPAPSFLYDESIGEMIDKQQKEDIRKSNILKQSIHLSESSKKSSSGGEKKYTANLRAIKFQNKLRKGSKRSVAAKRDLSEIQQQIQKLKQNKDAKPKVKLESMIDEQNGETRFDGKKRVSFIGQGDSNVKMSKSEVYHNPRQKSKFFKFKQAGT